MRLAFTGAGGTGKTTTAAFLAPKYALRTPKSAAREIFEELQLTEADERTMTAEALWDLQLEIFRRKLEIDKDPAFLADRTILDHWAYNLVQANAGMSDADFVKWADVARLRMDRYDLVVYFPIHFIPPSDGVRDDGSAYRSMIDALIWAHLERWEIPYITVPNASAGARADFISNVIYTRRIT